MARITTSLVAALWLLSGGTATAQYSQIESPLVSGSHSFYESFGVSWGLQGNGWFARFGAPGAASPFGGLDPAAQGQLGLGFRGNGFSGFLGFTAGQGSDTFLGGQSASVVVPNGGVGLISDTIQRPFVLGIVPVVGTEPVSPVKQALSRLREQAGVPPAERRATAAAGRRNAESAGNPQSSSADRGDLSVAEIRALQAAEDADRTAELAASLEKGRDSEAAGNLGLARIYYRQALRHAIGSQRTEINAKIRSLSDELRRPAE